MQLLATILCFLFISGCKQKVFDNNPPVQFTLGKVIDLPIQLHESSGLIYFDSLFWTFNDGGNKSEVYGIKIDSGNIFKVLTIENVDQTDWEDIAQDSESIFIGDFGNNNGSRENLSVIKFLKSQITDLSEQHIISEIIEFSYPDQKDFSANYRNTSFDCEALTCIGDSLILFTKDWVNYRSSVYKIPKIPGRYVASKFATINSEGLITGADYNSKSHQLGLVGYSNYLPFIILVENFDMNGPIFNDLLKITFDDFQGTKLEGIAFKGSQLFVSSEGDFYQQAIYQVIKNN